MTSKRENCKREQECILGEEEIIRRLSFTVRKSAVVGVFFSLMGESHGGRWPRLFGFSVCDATESKDF